jgi:hypothetical protein
MSSRKPDADESRFGSWRRRIDNGDDGWVMKLEYTSGQAEYEAGDYGAFADFHRRLVGTIEQPVVIE